MHMVGVHMKATVDAQNKLHTTPPPLVEMPSSTAYQLHELCQITGFQHALRIWTRVCGVQLVDTHTLALAFLCGCAMACAVAGVYMHKGA